MYTSVNHYLVILGDILMLYLFSWYREILGLDLLGLDVISWLQSGKSKKIGRDIKEEEVFMYIW